MKSTTSGAGATTETVGAADEKFRPHAQKTFLQELGPGDDWWCLFRPRRVFWVQSSAHTNSCGLCNANGNASSANRLFRHGVPGTLAGGGSARSGIRSSVSQGIAIQSCANARRCSPKISGSRWSPRPTGTLCNVASLQSRPGIQTSIAATLNSRNANK